MFPVSTVKALKKKGTIMSVLEIKDLHVEIEGKEILKGVNLTLKTGEIAAIMGPNGTGKSTLSAEHHKKIVTLQNYYKAKQL